MTPTPKFDFGQKVKIESDPQSTVYRVVGRTDRPDGTYGFGYGLMSGTNVVYKLENELQPVEDGGQERTSTPAAS